jgi:ribosomal protein S8
MRLTDPVADMLTRVRNALQARQPKVDVPASRLKLEISRILKEEGYISNFRPMEEEGRKVIRIYLKYAEVEPQTEAIRQHRSTAKLPDRKLTTFSLGRLKKAVTQRRLTRDPFLSAIEELSDLY